MRRFVSSDTATADPGAGSEGAVIGVDIGGTTMRVAEITEHGSLVHEVEVPSPARAHGREVVGELTRIVGERWSRVAMVGIGTAGVIEPSTGTILQASDSFRGWSGFPLRAALEDALGVSVQVENDVNAFLLGEQRFGAAAGRADCLGVMLGTGVGGAVVLDGRLRSGPRGAAAELGHMPGFGSETCSCSTPGHLESIASGRAIARRYQAARGHQGELPGGARAVARAAEQGDPEAHQVFAAAGEALGLAVVQAATLFDLETVVVGGGVASAWPLLEPGLAAALQRYPLISGGTIDIVQSTLGSTAVLLGAASLGAAPSIEKG